jgi:hypothetical protein
VKYSRSILAVTLFASVIGLAACSSASSPGSSPATQTTAPDATPSPTQTTGPTQAGGGCSYIDQKTAEGIIGFATAAGLYNPAASSKPLKKIDGCSYTSATAGSLGYDVLQIDAQLGQSMIGAIKSKMAGGAVTPFDIGLPNSVSFTQTLPAGVDSQVTVLSGDKFITVAATRKDGDVAKSQASAKAAAKLLVSHS